MNGADVKRIRLKNNLTQEEFGKLIGITKVAVSNIENGKRNMSKSVEIAIERSPMLNSDIHCDLSQVSTEDLLAELKRRCRL